jgi:fluoride exporter
MPDGTRAPWASAPADADRSRRRVDAGSGRRAMRSRWDVLLAIAAGGAVGSLARWVVAEALPHGRDRVPWSTVLDNVPGALLLGALMVFVVDVWPPTRLVRPFLGVGVLGGYTTFSTYMLDTRDLLAAGRPALAVGYLFGTLFVGIAAVWLGVVLARGGVALGRRRRLDRTEPDPTRLDGGRHGKGPDDD